MRASIVAAVANLSKSQIDKLGERLKAGEPCEEDLRILDEYRRSFGDAYEEIVTTLRGGLGLQPSGRQAKSTPSIVDKLRRESIRLTQIQDIAGCRVIVDDLSEQDDVVAALIRWFATTNVVDRRRNRPMGTGRCT